MPGEVWTSIGRALFRELQAEFSALSPTFEEESDGFLVLKIPIQPGLDFDVELNLQEDELHLSAGALWVEWFPCDDPGVVDDYREAVRGLLSGTYRIVEYSRGGQPFKAQLQRPDGDRWLTVKEWRRLHLPLPFETSTRILQRSDGRPALPHPREGPAP